MFDVSGLECSYLLSSQSLISRHRLLLTIVHCQLNTLYPFWHEDAYHLKLQKLIINKRKEKLSKNRKYTACLHSS